MDREHDLIGIINLSSTLSLTDRLDRVCLLKRRDMNKEGESDLDNFLVFFVSILGQSDVAGNGGNFNKNMSRALFCHFPNTDRDRTKPQNNPHCWPSGWVAETSDGDRSWQSFSGCF